MFGSGYGMCGWHPGDASMQGAREMLGGARKMGGIDHLVWFNTGTKGLKGRKWIKKPPK